MIINVIIESFLYKIYFCKIYIYFSLLHLNHVKPMIGKLVAIIIWNFISYIFYEIQSIIDIIICMHLTLFMDGQPKKIKNNIKDYISNIERLI